MGYLKLDPCDLAEPAKVGRHAARFPGRADITPPPHQFAGPKPRPKAHLSGAEHYALAHLAQRFAPGGQSVAAPEDHRLPIRLPPTRLVRAAPRGLRTLIAVLIFLALLPSLTLGAMYWLGAVDILWSSPLGPEDKAGAGPRFNSAAVMPRLDNVASTRSAAIRPVILTAPAEPVPSPRSNERLPGTWGPSEVYSLPPGAIYAPSLISIGAWDAQFRQLVATPSIDETATNLKAPAAPGDPKQTQPASAAETMSDDPHTKWIEPSAFVNLRKGPSSSAAVIGVIAKGTKLSLRARKRGWMQVANPATSEIGWIYAGNVSGEKLRRGRRRPADSGSSSTGSDALWSGLGQWLTSR